MANRENELRETDPEIVIITSPERTRLILQRKQLSLLLVKMGFRELVPLSTVKPMDPVFLLKDSAHGIEKMGVRIYIPLEDDHLQMAMLGNDDDANAAIVAEINAGGYFSAVKDDQENGVIGDYYIVTMIKEPPVAGGKIKYMSLGTSNRILALLKRVVWG